MAGIGSQRFPKNVIRKVFSEHRHFPMLMGFGVISVKQGQCLVVSLSAPCISPYMRGLNRFPFVTRQPADDAWLRLQEVEVLSV
jgi:hypothetical protein